MSKQLAIFFDFDGVILESANIKTEAFTTLFAHLPAYHDEIKAHHMENMGVSRYKKFEWIYQNLLGKSITDEESKQLGERFTEIVYQKILEAPFVPGAEKLLEWAAEHAISFVASGTPDSELKQIVKDRGLEGYFKEVHGSPASKTEIVEQMVQKYSLDKNNCWFIGDAVTDQKAALASAVHFIARVTPEMTNYWQEQEVHKANDLTNVQALLYAHSH